MARAQVVALKPRIPFLYGILLVNTTAFAFVHAGRAPFVLVTLVPGTICAVLAVRAVHWTRLDVAALDDKKIAKMRRMMVVLSAVIGLALLVWAELLHWTAFGSWTPTGHQTGNLEFYVGVSSISCISLLMHLSAAAVTLSSLIVVPFSILLLVHGGPTDVATAGNLLLADIAMTYVAINFGREFRRLAIGTAEMRNLSELNARMAVSDPLTGLPNRRSFFGDLERVSDETRAFAVLLLDLDGFKHVNDVYGHKAGDTVLLAIVERMQAILPPGATLARLGGDEFGCLLAAPEVARADTLAASLIAACRVPIECPFFTAVVGASIGICMGSPDGEPIAGYERADYALFQAKRGGRGRVVWFNTVHEESMRRASQIAHLLQSFEFERELSIAYQPVLCAETRTIKGFEALVRWHSPILGAISPGEFIPIAERSDLIFDITRFVARQALADAVLWPGDITVKVNVSVRDLRSRAQTEALAQQVRASAMPPERITFEVTETIFAESLEEVCSNVATLRSTGCKIAIDDFGVGYSSLNYIHMLSPDTIKIDRCFIEEVTTSERTRRVVSTIVELARQVGAFTVAEGVETEDQARLLCQLGCDKLQGFHLSRPLSPADAMAYAELHLERPAPPLQPGPPALQNALASAT